MNSSATGVARQVSDLLDAATPAAALDDDGLREELVACERAAQMLLARQGQMMVEMGARARAADQAEVTENGGHLWSGRCGEAFVADEIGVLLGATKSAAVNRYATAVHAADHRVLGVAWRAGRIDARRVEVIGEQITVLEAATAKEVAAAAVQYVTGHGGRAPVGRVRTVPQLREWLDREVITADPAAAEQRRLRALADRRVVITPGDDGMSQLWALLPSVPARQIQQGLSTAAQQLGAEDARTMDQRRVDTMVDLLLGRADPAEVSVALIVSADTLTGASDQPGHIPGVGPVTAEQARELAGHSDAGVGFGDGVSFRRLVTDPSTGVLTDVGQKAYRPSVALDRAVRARDVTCRFPGCRRAADSAGTDLDHTVPYPAGATSAANLAVLCRRHHRLKHTAGWSVTLNPSGVMTWTTPTGRKYQTHPWQYTRPDPPPNG